MTYLVLSGKNETQISPPAESELPDRHAPHYVVDTSFSVLRNSVLISGVTSHEGVMLLEREGRYVSAILVDSGSYKFPDQQLFHGENSFSVYGMSHQSVLTKVDSFTILFSSELILNLAYSVDKLDTDLRVCAFTFDAGSEANGADSILDILNVKNVSATIFLTGSFIRRHPQLVGRIVNEGHEYANHTYTHPHLTTYAMNENHLLKEGINRNFIQQQLLKTDSIFMSLTGRNLYKFWRSPFGEYNRQILLWAAEIGYTHIGWGRGGDTRDWVSDPTDPLYLTADQIKERILALADEDKLRGMILLMHLNSGRETDSLYRILGELISLLREKGYEFLTVSQLLQLRKPT